jgi:hypothetical protein
MSRGVSTTGEGILRERANLRPAPANALNGNGVLRCNLLNYLRESETLLSARCASVRPRSVVHPLFAQPPAERSSGTRAGVHRIVCNARQHADTHVTF